MVIYFSLTVVSLPILVTSPAKTNYSCKFYIIWIGFSGFRIGEPNTFLLLSLKFNFDKMAIFFLTMYSPIGILKLSSNEQLLKSISFDAEFIENEGEIP